MSTMSSLVSGSASLSLSRLAFDLKLRLLDVVIKAKLRLLFECAPIALIIEAAGGDSCVCASEAGEAVEPISILQVSLPTNSLVAL